MDSFFLDFEPVKEGISKIRVKLKYYNLTLISTTPQLKKKDVAAQQEFYSTLEKLCDVISIYDIKTIQRDFKAKI
jgi:hypothetical protein